MLIQSLQRRILELEMALAKKGIYLAYLATAFN